MTDLRNPRMRKNTERLLKSLFALTAAAVMLLSLLPLGPDAPSLGWDKVNHLSAFVLLALLGCSAYPGRVPMVLVGLLAYGGLIEVLQSFTSYRSAEWADLLADALGLPLGWMIARLVAGNRDNA